MYEGPGTLRAQAQEPEGEEGGLAQASLGVEGRRKSIKHVYRRLASDKTQISLPINPSRNISLSIHAHSHT